MQEHDIPSRIRYKFLQSHKKHKCTLNIQYPNQLKMYPQLTGLNSEML